MTISTSRTENPSIAKLARITFRRTGLLNEHQQVPPEKMVVFREELDLLVDHLAVEGVASRARPFEYITLVAGQRDYPLAESTLDVEGDGMFIQPGQELTAAAGETPLNAMTTQEWHGLNSKDAEGRPFRYWVDRTGDTLSVSLWPTPTASEASGSVRFVVHRMRADNMHGQATVDFERYWLEYIVTQMCVKMGQCYTLNLGRINDFRMEGVALLGKCRSASAPTKPTSFMIGHRTGWSR